VLTCSSESEASLQERGHCISKKLPPAPLPKIAGTRLAMVAALHYFRYVYLDIIPGVSGTPREIFIRKRLPDPIFRPIAKRTRNSRQVTNANNGEARNTNIRMPCRGKNHPFRPFFIGFIKRNRNKRSADSSISSPFKISCASACVTGFSLSKIILESPFFPLATNFLKPIFKRHAGWQINQLSRIPQNKQRAISCQCKTRVVISPKFRRIIKKDKTQINFFIKLMVNFNIKSKLLLNTENLLPSNQFRFSVSYHFYS